jgi:DNA polymerase-4
VIAHVQLSDFFIAVERAAHPHLAGRALLIGGAAAARGTVAIASADARAAGVHTGMRMADALARVPSAACVPGSIERYLETSAQIDERLRALRCAVEWASLDEVWIALGEAPAMRAARPPIEAVREELARDFGIAAAIGVGATKAVAAVASRLVSPSGMLIVLPGYEARLLAPVDIARLPGLTDQSAARLRARGISTLGDLAALDDDARLTLMGRGGSVLARHALGLDDRMVDTGGTPRGIVRAAYYGACGPSQARGAVARLADLAASALRRSGHAARSVRLRVRDASGERMRTLTVPAPIASDQEIGEQVEALARRLLHPGRELQEAAIFLSSLAPVEPQLTLFTTRSA